MKRTIIAEIKAKENEPLERLTRRFVKKVKKGKVLEKVFEKRYYEKPSDKRRKEAKRRKRVLDKLRKNQSR